MATGFSMGHGRHASPYSIHAPSPRHTTLLLLIAGLFAVSACGSPGSEPDPESNPDRSSESRSWAVDTSEGETNADASTADDGYDAGTSPDASGDDAPTTSEDANTGGDTDSDWTPIRCEDGQSTEAAFEGRATSPATQVTLYVRDDCVMVGSLATSTSRGNYNLTVRGHVDADGAVSMTGRATNRHAELTGTLDAVSASIAVDADFDGVSVQRTMSLARIE